MEKSNLRYSFEKMHSGKHNYQVRINGQFITYADKKDSALLDKELAELGYTSRKEVYDECVEATMNMQK